MPMVKGLFPMRRLPACFLFGAAALLLASCAQEPSMIVLAPRPALTTEDIGGQAPVLLVVADDRPAGDRQAMETLPPVMEMLQGQISSVLKAKGFRPVSTLESPTRRLEVHLSQLGYETESSTLKSSVTARMTLSVTAFVDGWTFTHTYRSADEETVALGASQATRERAVNGAVEELLTKLFADDQLYRQLSGKEGQ